MKKIILILCLITSMSISAQVTESDKTMLWTSFGLSKKINDKFSISYFQLNSLSLKDSRFNFIQPDLKIGYKLNKRWDLSINYTPTISLDTIKGNQSIYHRVSPRIRVSTKISKRIRMKNSITTEFHFTQRSKFNKRIYYRLDLLYRNTKLPWRLRPFITQKLYWYSGGKLLQYYAADGGKTDLKAPNGLHAYRIKTGIKLYPIDNFSFSLYYQKQKEFNSSIFGTREINSLNPNSNKIRRSFYDFSAIGISFNYKL